MCRSLINASVQGVVDEEIMKLNSWLGLAVKDGTAGRLPALISSLHRSRHSSFVLGLRCEGVVLPSFAEVAGFGLRLCHLQLSLRRRLRALLASQLLCSNAIILATVETISLPIILLQLLRPAALHYTFGFGSRLTGGHRRHSFLVGHAVHALSD